MPELPIARMTLFKHGVGFFERRATVAGEAVELAFRVDDMNDVLKSLTAIDWGGGQVLGIDYATPQSREERLAGCSIRLADDRSLRDLLASLRGRRVQLVLDQDETATGTLLGLDEVAERQPMDTSRVSLLQDGSDRVETCALGRVQGVELLDERGARDLRFFLETARTQEEYRQVTIRLSPGDHDLSVSYVAPAPTWRVSYRLVAGDGGSEGAAGALLLGWGIFDNRLEEDLSGIALSLVAGMPISFVYDLYTPFTPERPVVEEEARVAAAPVEFEYARTRAVAEAPPPGRPAAAGMQMAAFRRQAVDKGLSLEAMEAAAPVATRGEALGELFQYTIETPVTVARGHSAMVPIVSARLPNRKDLIYNGAKLDTHPVATLRLTNDTGLTLERGPVTVVDSDAYAGEGILPFTVTGGEMVVGYAVELGIRVREDSGARREVRGVHIKGAYLRIEEWDIRWTAYEVDNRTATPQRVLVERPRTPDFDLFDTPEPKERTETQYRFEVEVAADAQAELRVQERRLLSRREELRKQSYDGLRRYLAGGLLSQDAYDRLAELLALWEKIGDNEQRLTQIAEERKQIYAAQKQIQGNMGALSTTGKEGALRARYVEQLESTERQLQALAKAEAERKAEIEKLRQEIDRRLARMRGS